MVKCKIKDNCSSADIEKNLKLEMFNTNTIQWKAKSCLKEMNWFISYGGVPSLKGCNK